MLLKIGALDTPSKCSMTGTGEEGEGFVAGALDSLLRHKNESGRKRKFMDIIIESIIQYRE